MRAGRKCSLQYSLLILFSCKGGLSTHTHTHTLAGGEGNAWMNSALRAWDARAAPLQRVYWGQTSNTTTLCSRLMQTHYYPLNKEFANNNLKRTEKALSESTTVYGIKDVYSTNSKLPCSLFVLKAKIGFKKITIHFHGKQSFKLKQSI